MPINPETVMPISKVTVGKVLTLRAGVRDANGSAKE